MIAVFAFALQNWRLIALVAGVVAIVAAGLTIRHALIMQGEATALEQVDKANAQERQRADAASGAVSACDDSGGVWDRASGLCQHPAR